MKSDGKIHAIDKNDAKETRIHLEQKQKKII